MTLTSLFEYWVGINVQLSLYCYYGTKIQQLVSTSRQYLKYRSVKWQKKIIKHKNKYYRD